jgi:hypothetical protein
MTRVSVYYRKVFSVDSLKLFAFIRPLWIFECTDSEMGLRLNYSVRSNTRNSSATPRGRLP